MGRAVLLVGVRDSSSSNTRTATFQGGKGELGLSGGLVLNENAPVKSAYIYWQIICGFSLIFSFTGIFVFLSLEGWEFNFLLQW